MEHDESRVSEATQLLEALKAGDRSAANRLMPLVYDEFREMAERYLRQERADHTLQATALAHEAYLKLIDQNRVDWQSKSHFLAIAAQAMRRILVDHARRRNRDKRGGGRKRVPMDDQVATLQDSDDHIEAVHEALNRLAELDERQAKVVEMRFFGGLNVAEVAEALGVSKRTVEGDWTMARAWLEREIRQEQPE